MGYALDALNADVNDIVAVVSNNHHHRVIPYEKEFGFLHSLGYLPHDKYMEEMNLLTNAEHFEISHHLAHAWSVFSTIPFQCGLVVCMDGMGECYQDMVQDIAGSVENGGDYMHDLKLIRASKSETFVGQPHILAPGIGYREAESAYVFNQTSIVPVFKRWTQQKFPLIYNGGFEYMESLGILAATDCLASRSYPLENVSLYIIRRGLFPYFGSCNRRLEFMRESDGPILVEQQTS